MAVYMVLSFDSDEQAKLFAKHVLSGGGVAASTIGVSQTVYPKLEAVIKKPTKFCECPNTRDGGFTQGKKYGWWVHAKCRRPTAAWKNNSTAFYAALGINLLPESIAPGFRPKGWENVAEWNDLVEP